MKLLRNLIWVPEAQHFRTQRGVIVPSPQKLQIPDLSPLIIERDYEFMRRRGGVQEKRDIVKGELEKKKEKENRIF